MGKTIRKYLAIIMSVVVVVSGINITRPEKVEAANNYAMFKAKPTKSNNLDYIGYWYFPVRIGGDENGKNPQTPFLACYAGCCGYSACKLCGKRYHDGKDFGDSAHGVGHNGVDVSGSGDNIFAMRNGKVKAINSDKDRGKYVIIEHEYNGTYSYYSLYQHMSKISVRKGDNVSTGQVIGVMGSTGNVEGKHLHYEIWKNYKNKGIYDFKKFSFMEADNKNTIGLVNVNIDGYYNGSCKFVEKYRTGWAKESNKYHANRNVIKWSNSKTLVNKDDNKLTYLAGKINDDDIDKIYNVKNGTFKTYNENGQQLVSRAIYTDKNINSTIKTYVGAGKLVYVSQTNRKEFWGKVRYCADNKVYEGWMNCDLNATCKAGTQVKMQYVSDKDLTLKPITEKVTLNVKSSNTIPIGGTMNVDWNDINNATAYNVRLYKDGAVYKNTKVTRSDYYEILNNSGRYKISVQPINDVFHGDYCDSTNVDVMKDVTVKFVDYDDKVLSEQKIRYNADAVAPSAPSGREGYTFDGWDGKYQGVKSNTVVKAKYKVNKYKVTFYDAEGKMIGNSQQVEYMGAAKEPDKSLIPLKPGYIFMNWDKDFSCVKSNMDVYAVSGWENPTLPVKIVSATAKQDVNDGVVASYTVNVKVNTTNEEDITGRAIVALTTEDGNLLTATESDAFTISKTKPEYNGKITIPYTGQAAKADIYVINDYSYTSSIHKIGTIPISEKLTVNCTGMSDVLCTTAWTDVKPTDDVMNLETKTEYRSREKSMISTYKHVYWPNNWSAFTADKMISSDTRKVNTKVQYRYRDLTAWSDEKTSSSKPTESKYLTITGQTTNYYYFHYINKYTDGSYGVDSVKSGSKNGTTISKNLGKCVWKNTSKITKTANYGDIGGKTQYQTPGKYCVTDSHVTSHSGHCGNTGYSLWYYDKSETIYKYKTREWKAWSGWQDTYVAPSDTREVETRVLYQYKDARVEINDKADHEDILGYTWDSTSIKNTGVNYTSWSNWQDDKLVETGGLEVQSRELYRWKYVNNQEGEIVNGDQIVGDTMRVFGNVSDEFAGRQAICFVYKKGDASDYTTEYIGQVTLGDSGEFEFEFIPRETPSSGEHGTGDFEATLGIEGTDVVIKLDESNFGNPEQFKVPKQKYRVDFVDDNDEIIDNQIVNEGNTAIVPEVPNKEGYTFVGWNNDVTNINMDYTLESGNPIRTVYKINTYNVTYIDYVNDDYEIKAYNYGQTLVEPDNLEVESNDDAYDKIWSESFAGNKKVTSDMVVTANAKKKVFSATYYDLNDEVYLYEEYEYGDSVHLIDADLLSDDDIIVYDWKCDDKEQINSIKKNLEFKPVWVYASTVYAPEASLKSASYDKKQKVAFAVDNEKDSVYYTLDGSDPKENGKLYTDSIDIADSCILKAYAVRDKANESEVVTYCYVINKSVENMDWVTRDELPEEVQNMGELYGLESATGYRYVETVKVMSEEEIAQYVEKGMKLEDEVEYTDWTYAVELPEKIGDAEVEQVELVDGTKLYKYRYKIWVLKGTSPWTTEKPDVEEYEKATVYRYNLSDKCVVTFVYDNYTYDMIIQKGSKVINEISSNINESEEFVGVYKDDEYTDLVNISDYRVEDDVTLYVSKKQREFEVRYHDNDGNIVETDNVYYGETADDIEAPEIEGMTFVGWDKGLDNIVENTDFYPVYVESEQAHLVELKLSNTRIFTNTSCRYTVKVDGIENSNTTVWSSNDNVAKVEDGFITGIHNGSAIITAKLDSGERASVEINVTGNKEYELMLDELSELKLDRERNLLVLEDTMTVKNVKKQFDNEVVVLSDDGELADDDNVITGNMIKAKNVYDTVDIVVAGDISADGVIDENDIDLFYDIWSYNITEEHIGTARYMAADVDRNGAISFKDVELLEYRVYGEDGKPDEIIDENDGSVEINSKNFPDENFKNYISEMFDEDGDGVISKEDVEIIEAIDVSGKKILSIEGCELFTNLQYLNCSNNDISEIDVKKLNDLKELDCSNNKISKLDLSNNDNLKYLDCRNNKLSTLYVREDIKDDELVGSEEENIGYKYDEKVTIVKGHPSEEKPDDKPVDKPKNDKTDNNSQKTKENVVDKTQSDELKTNTNPSVEQVINALNKEKSLKQIEFGKLKFNTNGIKKNSVGLKWKKVAGAKKYVVYGNVCGKGKKYIKIATVNKLKYTVKKISGKKLKKSTNYKFTCLALDQDGKVITAAKAVHVVTAGGKFGNVKEINLTNVVNKKLTLKKGKTFTVKYKLNIPKGKSIADHRGVRFESSDSDIAKVDIKSGRITAKKKGKCKIFVYTQNGCYRVISVTIK